MQEADNRKGWHLSNSCLWWVREKDHKAGVLLQEREAATSQSQVEKMAKYQVSDAQGGSITKKED